MPSPEFDIWGGDWEKAGEEIDRLSTGIIDLWPSYEEMVNDVLNSPELDTQECYRMLLDIHSSILKCLEGAREVVEPWEQLTGRASCFDELADNDPEIYDWESEASKFVKFGNKMVRFAMGFGVFYGHPVVRIPKGKQGTN